MNKLNLLLLISLVALSSSCRKIELPDPKEEEPEFGLWSGQIGESPLSIENDSLFMDTEIVADTLVNVNIYQTSFTMLGSTQPQWIFKYRDSKPMHIAADTADLFYISKPGYLKDSLVNKDGYVVSHSLKDIEQGHEVIWTNHENTVEGGRHFSDTFENPSADIQVKAEIIFNGKSNSIEKIYKLPRPGIDLVDIKINGNEIEFKLDAISSTIRYQMGSLPEQMSNKFKLDTSGYYNFEITDNSNVEKKLLVKLYLELSNGNIKPPKLPIFSSGEFKYYPKLPNFSRMEIIYFDEDGIEYSTRYTDQFKPFIIKGIETFDKTNQQGQKVKKLDIEFSVNLQTADGSKSINFNGVKGDIGFAYE